VIPRHLPLTGRGEDAGAHPPHDRADLDIGSGDVFQERGGERTVAALAVERDIVGLDGKAIMAPIALWTEARPLPTAMPRVPSERARGLFRRRRGKPG
jgi:hypothetical protein